ncbi:MAG: hypothetical protein C0463_02910 [Idiomarina sp.]|nr:hypothetical protein [Idiomarina sp.]
MLGSLRKGLLLTTAGISALVCFACVSLFAWYSYQYQVKQLSARSAELGDLLSIHVSQLMSQQPHDWPDAFERVLRPNSHLLNVHVYLYNSQDELEFRSSYNRAGIAPITTRIQSEGGSAVLRAPQIRPQGIDYIVPIMAPPPDQQTLRAVQPTQRGYLFTRTDHSGLAEARQTFAVLALLAVSLAVLMALLMASLLSGLFTRPLNQLIHTSAEVARTRDYSIRAKRAPFYEIDVLSHNLNTVLKRIQQSIQERDKAQAASAALNRELEQQVTERTSALRQANHELLETLEQLHQHQGHQVEAQKLSSLSELVAGISHEINTPLGLAVTAASMLEEQIKAAPEQSLQHEQVDILQRNLTRAVELMNDFKKIAIDHASEHASAVDFNQMLEDIMTSARAVSEYRGKLADNVTVSIESELRQPIMAKVGIWQQIITSLYDNSLTHAFSHTSDPAITVSVHVVDQRLRICWHDNGCGVPADILRRIFDPFVTTKRGQGNSGLGMHVVYNLVTHTLGGSIRCRSEAEQGFEVTIECAFDYAN